MKSRSTKANFLRGTQGPSSSGTALHCRLSGLRCELRSGTVGLLITAFSTRQQAASTDRIDLSVTGSSVSKLHSNPGCTDEARLLHGSCREAVATGGLVWHGSVHYGEADRTSEWGYMTLAGLPLRAPD
ncbi:hypothetical protein AAFF_G00300170 [Aldrovandia affinis]|uniref:Uncharacterized protein n=1 Tax=Aldrovandia affinis TaxID=143900 RepID=A0AAD7SQJ9_9TELE|nr:hypothetical protein AAFF_G00300170 [Aldrovandia affinis]